MSNKSKKTEKEEVISEKEMSVDTGDVTAEGNFEAPIEEATDNLTQEAAEWQNKYLRLSAEFDNFRKRTLKEKMDLVSTAGAETIKSVLTILDDLERAVDANKKSDDIDSVKTGTEIISKKFSDLLRSKGVVEIDAMGNELDTDLHEAIAKFPVEDNDKKGKVIDVIEKGYKLNDKVIRFSKVVIGE